MAQSGGFVPDEIVVSRDRGEMRLVLWDGQSAAIAASSLRAACRCAWCTRDRILDTFVVATDSVAFKDVAALGSHGLHIKFSDGHERGIYPWAYIDELARGAQSDSASTCAPCTDTH